MNLLKGTVNVILSDPPSG